MNDNGIGYDWPLIISYHSVSVRRRDALAVQVRDFEYQMAWLYRHGYHSMTLAEFMSQSRRKGDRKFILTFDDGYADNYSVAFPVLQRYGFVATIFLVSDYVDTDSVFSWDIPKIQDQQDRALFSILTWEQVQEMAAYGIELGSHTCTHPRQLTTLTKELCWEEIVRSREDLEFKVGCKIVSFCYPRGDINAEVIRLVEKAGYHCAVISPPRSGIPLCRYTLRKTSIYHGNTPFMFRLKIMPMMRRHREQLERLLGK